MHATDGMLPFTERMVDLAHRLRRDTGARKAGQAELALELERLQNFTDISSGQAKRVRRRLSRDAERGRHAALDRAKVDVVPAKKLRVVPAELPDDEPDGPDGGFDDIDDLPLFGEQP
jgi:hypothetical protein